MMVISVATVSYTVTKQIHTSQVCLEINPTKTKYIFHPCYQKKEQNHNININNTSLENVAEIKYCICIED